MVLPTDIKEYLNNDMILQLYLRKLDDYVFFINVLENSDRYDKLLKFFSDMIVNEKVRMIELY